MFQQMCGFSQAYLNVFNERAAASKKYQWTTASERKNVQHIVLLYAEDCVAASRNILMFFIERTAAYEKVLTTASEMY